MRREKMKCRVKFINILLIIVLLSLAAGNLLAAESEKDTETKKDTTLTNTPVISPASIEYKLLGTLPSVPSDLPTYKAAKKDLKQVEKQGDAVADALAFNILKANKKSLDEANNKVQSLMFTDTNNTGRNIEYMSTGAVLYMDDKVFLREKSADILKPLNKNEAEVKDLFATLGDSFLKKNKLLIPGLKRNNVSLARTQVYDAKSKAVVEDKVIGVAVNYGLVVDEKDNISAWGPGAKLTIYYGGNKQITGYYNALRTLTVKDKKVEILTPDKVVDKYMSYQEPKSIIRSSVDAAQVKTILIDSVKLVYYLASGGESQEEVKPNYLIEGRFVGTDNDGNNVETNFTWLEDAVVD
jgi:hypothetical protein